MCMHNVLTDKVGLKEYSEKEYYKILTKRNNKYYTPYRDTQVVDNKLETKCSPDIWEGRLYGGAIHCYYDLNLAISKCSMLNACSYYNSNHIFKIKGSNPIAYNEQGEIAFKSIEILEKIE